MDDSTFSESTLQPPPVDDSSTLASEPFHGAPIPQEDVAPFEIGNMQDDEETGPVGDPNQHSLPDPEELKVTSPSGGKSPFEGCGKLLAWMFLIFALIIALTVGLVVGLNNQQTTTNNELSNSFTPVARDDVQAAMKTYVITNGVTSEIEFTSATSPQSRALDFLANKDPRQLQAPSSGLNTDEGYAFITRYVMALFYYALGGELWNYDLLFLSKHETCQWYDVFQPPVGQVGVLCNQNSNTIVGLSFISNQLDGSLPTELGVLTTLTYFESIANNIKGTIPDTLQKLTGLTTAVLAYNQITGTVPSWLSKWEALEFLYLSNNLITGSIPPTFNQLQQLSVLAVDDNALTGSMSFLWELPRMEYAYLEDNQFEGFLPQSITTTSPLLINLDISGNKLKGTLPSDLFQLRDLEILDLHGNAFEGPVPSDIPTSNLKLKFVALHQNSLGNAIPTQLGQLSSLEHLDLTTNLLSGDIPTQLLNLKRLKSLYLAENNFNQGPIPIFIYSFFSLRELSLKHTKRDGSISPLIQNLVNLVLLDLDDNLLSGSIPSEIGTIVNLEFLLLNRNKLTGAVPTDLGRLNRLRFLLLDNNNVTGNVEGSCGQLTLAVATADCEEVTCSCCNPCCTDGQFCHDNDLVPSIDPIWERGYSRQFFDFTNSSGYFIARPGTENTSGGD